MFNILKKHVATHHKGCHAKLFNALWKDCITPKVLIGNSPYFLVYGKEYFLPSNLLLPSLQLALYFSQDDGCSPIQNRIDTLLTLEEEREKYRNKFYQHQPFLKRWFDENSSTGQDFQVGELVLKWDKPHKEKNDNTKFQLLWLGPFTIIEKLGRGIV